MPHAPEFFETDRLVAERLAFRHLEEFARFLQSPADTVWLGGARPTVEVLRGIEGGMRHWLLYGFGRWIFRDRGTGQFAGLGGLRKVVLFGSPALDLGYALSAGHQGRGLGTEMVRVIVDVGFGAVGADQITAVTLPHNRASRRVLEKLGFRCEGEIRHAGLPHVLYRLRARDWRARHAR